MQTLGFRAWGLGLEGTRATFYRCAMRFCLMFARASLSLIAALLNYDTLGECLQGFI